ncbi:SLBB domain-containing protein [Treponema sp.]|uniref:SLBB domain-containing protein n=1 Tax=Treponema sp. TaxID=166 RepID=UPI00388F45AF
MKAINNFIYPDHPMFETSVRSFLPQNIVVPFCQADGKEYECTMEIGDKVHEGQTIAAPKGIISANGACIHSSVPGEIQTIVQCTLPDGKLSYAARIKTQGEFTFLGKKQNPVEWNLFSSATLLEEFKSKGIVNTFLGKTVSLATEIRNCTLKKHRFVIVRMFDEDPSRYTDTLIASHFTEKVIEGAKIAAKAFEAEGIAFVLPKKADFTIAQELIDDNFYVTATADNTKYPAGFIHSLMRQVRKTSKIPEYERFINVNHKCLFLDPETCLSIYDAIVLGIPVIERFVHVTGTCLNSAGMFKVRLGTTIRDLVEQCGGFSTPPSKIVINGLIRGNGIAELDIPITKMVKSIEFLPSRELCVQKSTSCIRCGRCRAICPEHLVPDLLYKMASENFILPRDIAATARICGQCALCNSVCPSRLSLCQTIALLNSGENNA